MEVSIPVSRRVVQRIDAKRIHARAFIRGHEVPGIQHFGAVPRIELPCSVGFDRVSRNASEHVASARLRHAVRTVATRLQLVRDMVRTGLVQALLVAPASQKKGSRQGDIEDTRLHNARRAKAHGIDVRSSDWPSLEVMCAAPMR